MSSRSMSLLAGLCTVLAAGCGSRISAHSPSTTSARPPSTTSARPPSSTSTQSPSTTSTQSPSTTVALPQLSIIAHPTDLEFVAATGASSPLPVAPLTPGDRVLGTDELLSAGTIVGLDYEVCTVSFALNVLCDDMLSFPDQGDVHATWTFRWPATGNSGPASFDGVIDGGTGTYHGVRGAFHAVSLPNRDVQITATLSS